MGQDVVLTLVTASAVREHEEKHVLKYIRFLSFKRGPLENPETRLAAMLIFCRHSISTAAHVTILYILFIVEHLTRREMLQTNRTIEFLGKFPLSVM
jgi:hypothetical protein